MDVPHQEEDRLVANDRQQRAARAEQMRKDRAKAERRQRNVVTSAIVVVVVALIALAAFAVKSVSEDHKASTDLVAPKGINKNFGFEYTAVDAGGEKPKGEPVKVVLTEDFQCPACQQFDAQSGAYLKDLVKKGEITVEYRPISFLDQASANEYSSRSLNAAMCVLDSDGVPAYKKMHEALFANQPPEGSAGPENAALLQTAKSAGYTGPDSCVLKKKFGPWIKDAYEAALDDGFKGTPWVRIGGKDIESPSPAAIQKAIDEAKKA